MISGSRSALTAFLFTVFSTSFAGHAAQAEIYYWQDPLSKVAVTVPDTWHQVHNQKPDDVVTFIGPTKTAGAEDFAQCRLRVNRDARYVMYPPRYGSQIRDAALGLDFWEDYVGQYPEGHLDTVSPKDGGLGLGFASDAFMTFVSDMAPRTQRRGIAIASIYRDKAYIFECSAEAEAFKDWYPEFMQVLQTVTLRNEYSQFPGGYYRKLHDVTPMRIMNGKHRVLDAHYY